MYEETIEKIKEECRIRNHSDLSFKQYVYHVSCFLKWIGDKPLDELTLADARDYIVFKRNTTCSPATCNGINSALSFFYRIILRKAWVYEEVPRMKEDWTLPAVCTREEIERLIDAATEIRNKAIIALAYSSGLRVGEICRLAPGDVYMSSMQVHLRNTKNHGDHWTILSERALELLKAYWRSCPEPRDVLFVSPRKPHRPLHPVKVMSAVFKKHYLAELKELRENDDLNYAGKCEPLRNGHAFKELLDRLYGMDWIAYSKKTFAGAREVFKYLGKYTHRIAISNRRIISVGEKDVTFYAKDY